MNISGKTIWQQAAGDTDRNYADLCLKFGVILNGPGHLGGWPACEVNLRKEGWSSKKISDLKRFADEMQDGDLVVLRNGTSEVRGVGQIVGSYQHSEEFGDIDGWRLQHVRRVRWLWNGEKQFDSYALKLGDTTQKLNNGLVSDWLLQIDVPAEAFSTPLAELPNDAGNNNISVDAISEFLFDQGVASSSISHLLQEIGELTRIAKWYQRSIGKEGMPSEHETVAYLVVPLLRALGWTPQRMGVEWNRVDVALFEQLPRSDAALQVVVEVKKMDNSCLSAASQAGSYAEGKSACKRLIVTDGLRYGIYTREGVEPFSLYAYMNLARLRERYPIYGCKGANEAVLAMAPEWREAKVNLSAV
jgi:hypothetical protein